MQRGAVAISLTVAIGLGALLVGGIIGAVYERRRAPPPDDGASAAATAEAMAAQTEAIAALTAEVNKPAVLSEELKAQLASDIPAGCLEPAASLEPVCVALVCQRAKQSSAGRCDTSMVQALVADYREGRWRAQCHADLPLNAPLDAVDACVKDRADLADKVK
jgi:hypothetical protein|tara:strand:- start:289 stop:777 length:489 start_codon:yes stop_codon:yes gene_type:complete